MALIRLHQAHKARESIVGSAEHKEDGQCALEERSDIVHSRLCAGLIAHYEKDVAFVSFYHILEILEFWRNG